jgi:hypothetical protein
LGFGDGDDGGDWSEGELMPCQLVAAVVVVEMPVLQRRGDRGPGNTRRYRFRAA